jgi:TatA/E family protein of Tat protein translocase
MVSFRAQPGAETAARGGSLCRSGRTAEVITIRDLLSFISMPGGMEWVVIGIIGLLVFGKRLPEVCRSLGTSVTEFKKGLREAEEEARQNPDAKEPTDLHPPMAGL